MTRERKKRRQSSKAPSERKVKKLGENSSGKPELLAPAGNIESFFSAVNAGADAVYIGLPRFNARIRADNFSIPDLAKLIPYAHTRGARVYITTNTQMLEEELPYFIDLVSSAFLFAPDAFIVGDLGAIEIIRKHFPRAEMHASTMMGNFNARILDAYARLGIKRTILERHLDFEQVKEAIRRSPVDVEVFVHGALCFSYSGKCFFSSYLGGKSGNRGECVQPCRRVYRDVTMEKEGSFFSARDLSLMRFLPELMKIGVRAFKIEGRMRGVEYVHHVVSAYRKAIDEIYAGRIEEGIRKGDEILEGVIGREETGGIISGGENTGVVASENSGAVGEFIGKVAEVRGPFVSMDTEFSLKRGERLRVQDHLTGKGTGFSLLTLERKSSKTWIKVPFDVKHGDLLYRVSSRSDRKKITEKAGSRFVDLPSSGIQFNVSIHGSIINISGTMNEFKRKYTFRVEGRKKETRMSQEGIIERLENSYGGDFPIGKVIFNPPPSEEVPLDDLVMAFRRASKDFDKSLYLMLKKKRVEIISSLRLAGRRRDMKPTGLYAAVDTLSDAKKIMGKVDYVIVTAGKTLVRKAHNLLPFDRDKLILRLPLGQSDALLTFYRTGVKKFVRMGFRKFLIPDMGWVKVFKEAGLAGTIELISDHYIYTFNTASCVLLQRLGISRFVLPLETTFSNLSREAKFIKGLGIFPIYMNVPLLVTRLKTFREEGERNVISKMGEKFKVVTDSEGTTVFPEKKYSASGHIERIMKLGVTDFLVDLRRIDPSEAESVLDHVLKDKKIKETTTFNLFRDNF